MLFITTGCDNYNGLMLHWLISKRLDAAEKKLGASMDYLRYILKTSTTAFFRFTKIMPLAEYRQALPADAYHVARLVAVLAEDCGSCVQIEVNLARQHGVATEVLQVVLEGKLEALPKPLQVVHRFANAVVQQTGDDVELRSEVLKLYGDAGLVELSLGIAVAKMFPTTKRALGYAVSCSKMKVEFGP